MHGDGGGKFVTGSSDFHNVTTVHPLGLSALVLLGLIMIALPRRHAILPVLICASFIPVAQRIVILTLDFNFLKIMVIFGWIRVLIWQEYRSYRFQRLDGWFVAWAACSIILYPLSHMNQGVGALILKLGTSFESVGMYFLARLLVRTLDDVRVLVKDAAIIALPICAIFFVEFSTRRNLFSIFGSVPEITVIREGKLRCQGAYAHPILAGCFWAVLIPLYLGRFLSQREGRFLIALGLIASLGIVGMCSSSTPVAGILGGCLATGMVLVRKQIGYIKWGVVLLLIVLHFSMNVPVWHLVARTDLIGGSTGWHRYQVIDQFIKHTSEWFICGTANIYHWNIFANDITNQYAIEGIRAGAPTLFCFIAMILTGFANIGRMWRQAGNVPRHYIMSWGIGASLFVHTVNFIGVTYFGQIDMLWYISLALTAVVPTGLKPGPARQPYRRYVGQMAGIPRRMEMGRA